MNHNLGIGVGLRSTHYSTILNERPKINWLEAISENYFDLDPGALQSTPPLKNLLEIRDHYPVALHGVSMSIGSSDEINPTYLRKLKDLINAIDPLWVSDHLCWTGIDGENLHDLLPLPYTEETIRHVAEKILYVQDTLKRPLVIENVSAYLSYTHSEMSEWEFIKEIIRRCDSEILLDVNNVYVSSKNQNFNPIEFIKTLPKARIREIHLAGHSSLDSLLVDTHDGPVCDEVWDLYKQTISIIGPRPTLIEWDDKIPEFSVLFEEAKKAEVIMLEQKLKQEKNHAKHALFI
jgi:uncharacterized protein